MFKVKNNTDLWFYLDIVKFYDKQLLHQVQRNIFLHILFFAVVYFFSRSVSYVSSYSDKVFLLLGFARQIKQKKMPITFYLVSKIVCTNQSKLFLYNTFKEVNVCSSVERVCVCVFIVHRSEFLILYSNLPLKSTVDVTCSFFQAHSRAICKSENYA